MRTRVRFLSLVLLAVLGLAVACNKKGGGPSSIDDLEVDETLTLPGLTAPADVVRDELGRPHVYAATVEDAAMVAGWLHASDRFVQMDIQRRFGSGRVADLVGAVLPAAEGSDKRMRAIGLHRAAQEIYDGLPAGSPLKALIDAYTTGVNARLALFTSAPSPEYQAFGYPWAENPAWTAVDTLTVGRLLAFDLAWDGDQEVGRALAAAALESTFGTGDPREGILADTLFLFKPPVEVAIVDPQLPTSIAGRPAAPAFSMSAAVPVDRLRTARDFAEAILHDPLNLLWAPDKGSNNWVVGGARTRNGHPILANDPHLGLDAPPIWYELHLNTKKKGGTLDVIGVSLPGVPLVIIGGNGDLAWGVTNVGPDVTDVYVEHFTLASNGDATVTWDADGPGATSTPTQVALAKEDEVIAVRTGAGVTNVPFTVYRVPHRNGGNAVIVPGTMVNGTALSWSWTGFEATGELETIYELATASGEADLIDAVATFDVPPQNFVYADREGNFGYIANGWYPVRGDDDGDLHTDPPFLPMPGYDGAHEWVDRVPIADVPQESSPARGWVATANQDPLGHTFDDDPVNDAWYLGAYYAQGFRGHRIDEVLAADDDVTIDDMKALQGDHVSNVGRRLVPFLLEAIGTGYAAERALLEGWRDRGYHAASGVGDSVPASEVDDAAATSLFNVWLVHMADRALGDEAAEAGVAFGDGTKIRTLLFLLEHPTDAATYDAVAGESVLWDDLTTVGTVETQADVFAAALDDALSWLASGPGFGSADPTDWRWGLLHTLTVTRLSGLSAFDIPDPSALPDGFSRHSDMYAVDVGNGGIGDLNFAYGSGASQRLVVELAPDRMEVWNGIPGGTSGDPESPHYADQADGYAANGYFRTWFLERDVARNAESRAVFQP